MIDDLYLLLLNPVRANMEQLDPVAWSTTREALIAFVQAETLAAPETVTDGPADMYGNKHEYHLTFREGPLRWYNPPTAPLTEDPPGIGGGILLAASEQDAVEAARMRYRQWRSSIECGHLYVPSEAS